MKRLAAATLLALLAFAAGCSSEDATPDSSGAPETTLPASTPTPTQEAGVPTSEPLSFACGLATRPGLVLASWLDVQQGGTTSTEFADEVSDTATDIRTECPQAVISLIDDLEAQALRLDRGEVGAADVEAAIKAYWQALGVEDGQDPEQAYLEAVEDLSVVYQ